MKFTKIVIGAMLMASAAAASAATYDLGTLDLTDTQTIGSKIFGTNGTAFSDTYTFKLASQSDFLGFVGSTRLKGSGLNLTAFNLSQNGSQVAWGSTSTLHNTNGAVSGSFASIDNAFGLNSGLYSLTIGGTVVGNAGSGSYGGTINVSPVPEPETWGLTLSGLAAVGFLARRRKAGAQKSA